MMLTEKLALETSLLYIVKDTKRNRLNIVKSFSKENMAFDPTGHDFLHAQRVAKLAQKNV